MKSCFHENHELTLLERTHSFKLIHSVNHTVNHSVLHNDKLGRFHIVVDSFHSVDNRKRKEHTHSQCEITVHTVNTVWNSHCEWVWKSVFFPAGKRRYQKT